MSYTYDTGVLLGTSTSTTIALGARLIGFSGRGVLVTRN